MEDKPAPQPDDWVLKPPEPKSSEPKPPAEAEAVKKPSPHELIRLRRRQRMVQVAAAAVFLVLSSAVVLFLMGIQPTTTTTTTSTTTSTSAATTSTTSTTTTSLTTTTSTTLLIPSSGDVKVVAYQFKVPYTPEKNYLEEEWVVLKNAGNVTVNMTDWKIKNRNYKNTFTLPEFYLKPGSSVKIHTGRGMDTESDIYMGYSEEFWNNEIDTITVFDKDYNVVDFWKGLARTQIPSE